MAIGYVLGMELGMLRFLESCMVQSQRCVASFGDAVWGRHDAAQFSPLRTVQVFDNSPFDKITPSHLASLNRLNMFPSESWFRVFDDYNWAPDRGPGRSLRIAQTSPSVRGGEYPRC